MTITKKKYERELIDFEPKMRSMINNFRRVGYLFVGYDNDDLTHELFVKALDIRGRYEPDRAALRTWWYRCFRSKLVKVAEEDRKAMLWAIRFCDLTGEIGEPVIIQEVDWKVQVMSRMAVMMDNLWSHDQVLARLCQSFIDNDGEKDIVSDEVGMPLALIEYNLTKLRSWRGSRDVLDCIPF